MLPLLPIGLELAKLVGPKIAKWIAGDSGEKVAGELIGMAQDATGTTEADTALAALSKDPQALLAFKARVMDPYDHLEELVEQDRAGARNKEIEIGRSVASASSWQQALLVIASSFRADVLAFAAVTLLGYIVVHLLNQGLPTGADRDILFTVLGSVTTLVVQVYAYDFGTTRSSRAKDSTIAQALKSDTATSLSPNSGP